MLGWNAPACGTFLDSFERLILRVPLVFFPRFFFSNIFFTVMSSIVKFVLYSPETNSS